MSVNVFLDTNILLYGFSSSDNSKREIVHQLLDKCDCFISTQVLQECSNILIKKFNLPNSDIYLSIKKLTEDFNIIVNDETNVLKAIELKSVLNFSFYDALILSAALNSACENVFSEDLHHQQKIENKLVIINPFL